MPDWRTHGPLSVIHLRLWLALNLTRLSCGNTRLNRRRLPVGLRRSPILSHEWPFPIRTRSLLVRRLSLRSLLFCSWLFDALVHGSARLRVVAYALTLCLLHAFVALLCSRLFTLLLLRLLLLAL